MNNSRQNIIVYCSNCHKTYLIKNLDRFLEYKWSLWRMIFRQVENGYSKQKLIGSLAVCSAKETLIEEINENGSLIATCLSCMTAILKKIYSSREIHKISSMQLTNSESSPGRKKRQAYDIWHKRHMT